MKPNSCACYGSNDIHECYCNLNNNNMKQETLEEAAERMYGNDEDGYYVQKRAFELGAQWQQERSYSEEDMQEYAEFCVQCFIKNLPCIIAKDWFAQFKKK
jgi:hypothetical protein